METPYRSSRIADLSAEDRPREKALAIGVEALTTTELVALLLGSGTPGESVINLSQLHQKLKERHIRRKALLPALKKKYHTFSFRQLPAKAVRQSCNNILRRDF